MAVKKTKANGKGASANGVPATTAQRLGTILKASRDIMRKDKGLSGEIDRIPVLTWIMFLKFLDDMESMRAEEAKLSGKKFKPAIEQPYRWRDWAAKEDGITGDELIAFINQEECRRPDGSKGPGLFAYLRALRGAEGGDRRDVIATVFKGTVNRMINGYLLRDVINKVNGIHFTSSDEILTLGNFYESMLKEMRDAAGDSGEFYTPRAVVRFMVEVIDPKIGETVLDPACGTGGFLVEAYSHMGKQCKTVQQRRQLQQETILGNEAKPLPYLLAQMNLLLHGLETPRIELGNSLAVALREIGDKDRVDVILTNPPFGGEEERGILANFPADKQTTETALLFLQLIMRKLQRRGSPGRAAVIVPDGVLSQEGVAARVRAELLENFNLHTIVRLPKGVFEPYTKSSTSVLFFDAGPPSDDVWYYEIPLRSGLKAYTQHRPFTFDECADVIAWWRRRRATERAWLVRSADLAARGYDFAARNPREQRQHLQRSPSDLLKSMRDSLSGVSATLQAVEQKWGNLRGAASVDRVPLGQLLTPIRRAERLQPDKEYPVLGMAWYSKGLYVKYRKLGSQIKASVLNRIEEGDFVYSRLFAWKGSFAEAEPQHHGCFASNEFPTFRVSDPRVVCGYLWAYFSQPGLWMQIEGLSSGTTSTSRLRLKEPRLLSFLVPLPAPSVQSELVELMRDSRKAESELAVLAELQPKLLPSVLERVVPLADTVP